MSRSRIIQYSFAVFCCLTLQWQTHEAHAESVALHPGQHLLPNQSVQTSNNYTLIMQSDGNVVLYNGNNRAVWATNTKGIAPRDLVMQDDGNLVLYSVDGQPRWASNTNNNAGAYLRVQDDGNLVVYRPGSPTRESALWASNTVGK